MTTNPYESPQVQVAGEDKDARERRFKWLSIVSLAVAGWLGFEYLPFFIIPGTSSMPAVYWFGMFLPTAFLLLCAFAGAYTEFFGKELSLRMLPYCLFPSIIVSCWIFFEISWEYRNSMMDSMHFRYWFDLAVMLVAACLYPVYLAFAFFRSRSLMTSSGGEP